MSPRPLLPALALSAALPAAATAATIEISGSITSSIGQPAALSDPVRVRVSFKEGDALTFNHWWQRHERRGDIGRLAVDLGDNRYRANLYLAAREEDSFGLFTEYRKPLNPFHQMSLAFYGLEAWSSPATVMPTVHELAGAAWADLDLLNFAAPPSVSFASVEARLDPTSLEVVPLPAGVILFGSAGIALAAAAWRTRRQAQPH